MSRIAADNNKAAIGVNVAPILRTPRSAAPDHTMVPSAKAHSRSAPSAGDRSTEGQDVRRVHAESVLPKEVEHWSLTALREKLVKIGAKVVSHGRYVTFQLAEVAVARALFAEILRLIDGLQPAPLPP